MPPFGTFETRRPVPPMSVDRGRTEVIGRQKQGGSIAMRLAGSAGQADALFFLTAPLVAPVVPNNHGSLVLTADISCENETVVSPGYCFSELRRRWARFRARGTLEGQPPPRKTHQRNLRSASIASPSGDAISRRGDSSGERQVVSLISFRGRARMGADAFGRLRTKGRINHEPFPGNLDAPVVRGLLGWLDGHSESRFQ
jgi:hypothetical protein